MYQQRSETPDIEFDVEGELGKLSWPSVHLVDDWAALPLSQLVFKHLPKYTTERFQIAWEVVSPLLLGQDSVSNLCQPFLPLPLDALTERNSESPRTSATAVTIPGGPDER